MTGPAVLVQELCKRRWRHHFIAAGESSGLARRCHRAMQRAWGWGF